VTRVQYAGGSEGQRIERVAGKRGLAQGWIPLRKQERRLLRRLEQAPLRRQERFPLKNPVRAPVRVPLLKLERRPLRHEDRVRVMVQVQHQEGALFRVDVLVPMRCQVVGTERPLLQQPERLPFPMM